MNTVNKNNKNKSDISFKLSFFYKFAVKEFDLENT